ncbi:MAG: sigma-70 family RNA polymerase sigma factor [Pseudomonadota bacterium]|nr:sigma-70 family RNA polymerase sigma factor [Pseudomonadota bacterium]
MSTESTIAKDLMAKVLRNDTKAFAELYDRYSRVVYSVIVNIVRAPAEAEEILQEVFVTLWNKRKEYDFSKSSPVTWMIAMARNRAIDKLRSNEFRGTMRSTSIDNSPALSHLQMAGDNPLDEALLEERQKVVQAALHALPQDQQTVIRIAYFEGLSQSEIAERYSIPLGTVKTRMRLGMKKLYEILKEAA